MPWAAAQHSLITFIVTLNRSAIARRRHREHYERSPHHLLRLLQLITSLSQNLSPSTTTSLASFDVGRRELSRHASAAPPSLALGRQVCLVLCYWMDHQAIANSPLGNPRGTDVRRPSSRSSLGDVRDCESKGYRRELPGTTMTSYIVLREQSISSVAPHA